ncbi:MAG: non-homologous end-joining DNA ligase [Actinomycetota bacterium]|nr:non-homologous end-joining DNA ligase [Actinomycetota bacterium]
MIDGRTVPLTNLDKVLWPDVGYTKRQMISYYAEIAPVLLPHIAGRPLTTKRYPDGVEGTHWYQTECFHPPRWLKTIDLPSLTTPGKTYHYCSVDDVASLIWLANTAAIEIHPLIFRGTGMSTPSYVVFDLDPGPPATVIDACRIALLLKDVLTGVGLKSFAKTSGGKGIHVYAPLNDDAVTFDATKRFAREVASVLASAEPDRVTGSADKSIRSGKVLIDWRQNGPTNSTVCPYSLRAASAPTVSTPVLWDEIESAVASSDPHALVFLPQDVFTRVERHGDVFEPTLTVEQRLPG